MSSVTSKAVRQALKAAAVCNPKTPTPSTAIPRTPKPPPPPPPPAAANKTTSKSKPTSSKSSSSSSSSTPPKPRTFARPTGILKLTPVSPELRKFLGVPEVARTEAVKRIWSYIKLHNLQNPVNMREIICDDKLKTIFEGREKVGFLEIGKLLAAHFVKKT